MKSKLYVNTGLFLAVLALAVIGVLAFMPAQRAYAVGPTSTSYFITAPGSSDPCQNPSVLKSVAPIAITSNTTTAIVTAVSGSHITVCKWQYSAIGTTTAVTWEYGTVASTACDTGATVLTGAMLYATAGIYTNSTSDGLTLRTPKSQELCILTAGTTGLQGYVTYVQAVY